MMKPDKLKISPTLHDIEEGIKNGVPKSKLYRELSEIADASRGKNDPVSETVFKKLREEAEIIHHTTAEKNRG